MRNLLNIASFALLMVIVSAWTVAAPAPPHLEELAPFRVELSDTTSLRDEIKKRSLPISESHLRRDFKSIYDLSFSPDGTILYTTTFDGPSVWIWDVAKRKLMDIIELRGVVASAQGISTVFSPDGKTAATWGGQRIALWDTSSRKILGILEEDDTVRLVTFSHDSKTLSAHLHAGPLQSGPTLRIWKIDKKARAGMFKTRYLSRRVIADGAIKTALFVESHRSGDLYKPQSFTLVDAFTGRSVLTCEWMEAEAPMVSCFAMNRAETIVASAGTGSPVQLWDRNSSRCIARFKPHPYNCASLIFNPNGTILAAYYNEYEKNGRLRDHTFVLHHVRSGKTRAEIKLPDERPAWGIPAWAFSPDGRLLAVKTNEEIKVWRIPDAWRRN